MRDLKLSLSLVKFLSILECSIEKTVNEHGHATISGYIDQYDEEALIMTSTGDRFAEIEIEGENQEKEVLFAGFVESIRVESSGGLKKVLVTLIGGTRLLEGVKHTRTFQNKNMTYQRILEVVEKAYDKTNHLMHQGREKTIEDMIVQYKETDWDFIKRLASHFNSCILPFIKQTGIKYHFGLPTSGVTSVLEATNYSIKNDIDELWCKRGNQVSGIGNKDAYYYEVESRELYDLGDALNFQSQILYVYSMHTELVGAELLHTYSLKRPGGFKLQKQYNTQLIGASLEATILAVAKDTVKVCVSIDGQQDSSTAKWFPFSTVYSSPDGTGWYCMPEEKDKVRLYFPNEKEEEGYIISSIHLETGAVGTSGTAEPPRSNPDNKSISSKYNKLVELTPKTITISNNKGMTIKLDDDEGINIISDKNVLIHSGETLSIKSLNESMSVEARESIQLIQGGTRIILKEDVTIEGAKFKVQ